MPFFTFSTPTMAPQSAPARAAARRHTIAWITGGSGQRIPITAAASEPTTYCPSAPMLKTPVRKENATESPVKISGAA